MMPNSPHNEFEEARRQRIQRNEQVLQQLGLLRNPLSGKSEAQQRAEAAERRRAARERQRAAAGGDGDAQQLEPTRRSRRLQGEAVENVGMNIGCVPSSERQRPQCSPVRRPVHVDLQALEGGSDPSLDAHNVMRVKSMGDRALQTRIWKIQRVDKLHSFIKVLDACGKAELAAEAREALAAMVGSSTDAAAT